MAKYVEYMVDWEDAESIEGYLNELRKWRTELDIEHGNRQENMKHRESMWYNGPKITEEYKRETSEILTLCVQLGQQINFARDELKKAKYSNRNKIDYIRHLVSLKPEV